HMPQEVQEIEIENSGFSRPVECSIYLCAMPFNFARLKVYGGNVDKVTRVFDDLNRELLAHSSELTWIRKYANSSWQIVPTMVIVSVAILCVFNLVLGLTGMSNNALKSSDNTSIFYLFCFTVAFGLASFAPVGLRRLARFAIPPIEFRGKLRDMDSNKRRILYWVGGAIFLPIVLNVFWAVIAYFWGMASTT
ncbi:MAG: hypothetical protein ACKVT0_08960, partial [Planctomycetaceae bacterium]